MEKNVFAVPECLYGKDLKALRKRLKLTQIQFADLAGVSVKTVERWETQSAPVTGPIVTLCGILREHPEIAENLKIPEKEYSLRLWYMYREMVCTIIDADVRGKKVKVKNFTDDYLFRAFGKEENPSFQQFEAFLESRCFPESRDKMKLILRELDIPFYDPLLIIEKTQGKMAEDEFWIKMER